LTVTLVIATLGLASVAAIRSTWSPCGLSMLSSITPMGERGRGQRFAWTAGGYLVGAVAGGATLGAVLVAAAVAVRSLDLPVTVLVATGAVAALAGAAADTGLLGFGLPVIRRQVNERWLDRFRGWVYGAGFGWQIGVGFVTYVMTAALGVVVVLAAVASSPVVAFAAGLIFGTVRGGTVMASAGVTDTATLLAAHRRYDAWRRPVWVAVVVAQLVVAGALGAQLWLPVPAVLAVGAAAFLIAVRPTRLAARVVRPVAARCPAGSGPSSPGPA
jgi:hypothetical protein